MKQFKLITILGAIVLLFLLMEVGCSRPSLPTTSASAAAPAAPAAPAPPPKVIFIGDSITYLWDQPGFGQPYFHANWIDKGIIGQNSNQILARFQQDVVALKPDVVHILTGSNEVYPGWTLGPSEVPDVFQNAIDSPANIQAMVSLARAAGIKVVLATIPPWNCPAQPQCGLAERADPTPGRYDRIETWNQWLRDYAFAEGIPVADYHSALEATDGKMYVPGLTIDGVHPQAAGFALMSPLAEAAIAQAVQP